MKKFDALLVLLLMLASFTTNAQEYPRGDANQDGHVSISDVTCLIDYLLTGAWNKPSAPQTETFMVNGVSFTMVAVEGGTFTMGAPDDDNTALNSDRPTHQVTLSSFCIGMTEVTQELWQAVMGNNPSYFHSVGRPVENVTWNDCLTFISLLNEMTGKTFRLPTEAEWEYAARGGILSQGYMYSGSNTPQDVAWFTYSSTFDGHERAVATKAPNELGIYDMSGNVREWCHDWFDKDYYIDSPSTNPKGPSSGTYRVNRGGGANDYGAICRVYRRSYAKPTEKQTNLGLRLAL